MNEPNYPERKDEAQEAIFSSMYQAKGWNACHDAFMKVIKAQPKCVHVKESKTSANGKMCM